MPDDERARPDESVITLRNTMRRPLTFRVAGKTVRLSPGQRLEAPLAWLGSAELQRFCGAGLVSAQAATQKSDRTAEKAEETGHGDEGAQEKRDEKSPKGESKQPKPDRPKTHNPRE